jgi:hypothetical protein
VYRPVDVSPTPDRDVLRPFPTPAEIAARLDASWAGPGLRRARASGASSSALVAVAATLVCVFTASRNATALDYFVRLAAAFLQGHVYLTDHPSWLSELIPHHGVYYVAYPPMPAVILMPFVAVFGVAFP